MITYSATNTSFVKLLAEYDEGFGVRQISEETIVEITNKQFYNWNVTFDKFIMNV